jgi:hypothetical protein
MAGAWAGVLAAALSFALGLTSRKFPGAVVVDLLIFLAGPAVISNVALKIAQGRFDRDTRPRAV